MRTAIFLCGALLLPLLASAKDRLYSGQQLISRNNDFLMSPNGLYTLENRNGLFAVYRADGSLENLAVRAVSTPYRLAHNRSLIAFS